MAVPPMRCPNPRCREVVSPADRYCEACGELLLVGARADGSEPQAAVPTPEGSRVEGERDRVEVWFPGLAGVSDRGLRRSRNEDAMALRAVDEEGALVMVVCDGVSSSVEAGLAAQAAAEAALSSLCSAIEAGRADTEAAMREAAREAQQAVCAVPYSPEPPRDPPSSTLVAAVVRETRVTIGWLGDSRAYFIGSSGAWQLSRDHTSAVDQAEGVSPIADGQADLGEAGLTGWLGADSESGRELSVRTFELPGAGHLLLCSDGLWNYAPAAEQMHELLADLPSTSTPLAVALRLTEFARSVGGHDNITVVVAAVGELLRGSGQPSLAATRRAGGPPP